MAGSTTAVPSTESTTRPRSDGFKTAILVAAFGVVVILVLQLSPQKHWNAPINAPWSSGNATNTSSIQDHTVTVVFINAHDVELDLFFIDEEGKEDKQFKIPAGGNYPSDTYVGNDYIFRVAADGKHVKSFTVVDNVTSQVTSRESPFHEQYFKENGFSWLNVHPRPPMTKWIPDPVAIGNLVERQVGPDHYTTGGGVADISSSLTLAMTTLAMKPKVFVIDDFLSADECDHIIELALQPDKLERSKVAPRRNDSEVIDARTSSNMWLPMNESKIVENIFRRGFNMMNVEFNASTWSNHSSMIQVLRYQKTQEYKPHNDFLHPSHHPDMERLQTGRNRYGTLFLYLNDVEEGGETVFPRFGGSQPIDDACTNPSGFKVTPKKGSAALFFSMLPDGNLDRNALHGGCPVIEGEKWAANFWFWDPTVYQD